MKSIREISRTLGNLCVAVGESKHLWNGIEDDRIQSILALCGSSEVYHQALVSFCLDIADLPYSPTEGAFSTYKMRADWYSAWKWFTTHPDAVCLVDRAIESNAAPENLEQFNFKLSWFITLALEKELTVICQATKKYILEVCQEQ